MGRPRSVTSLHSGYVEIRRYNPPPPPAEVWWRAEDRRYANYDPWAEFEQPSGSHLVLHLTPYMVTQHTPKGVWLKGSMGEKHFVLGSATKQHAVPTIELAIKDLMARRKHHVAMCQARLNRAKEHLSAVENWLKAETEYEEKQNVQNP